jgi:hypothetical protein
MAKAKQQRTAVVLECDDLRLLIGRTVPFAAKDDARPVLNAVRLDLAKDRVIAAAVDGYILGVQSSPAEVSGPLEGVTVPLEGVQAIVRMIPKGRAVVGRRVRLSWEPGAPVRCEVFVPGAPAVPAREAQPDAIEDAYEAWPVQVPYPDYRQLIPEWDGRESLGAVALASHLLERVLKAWKAGRDHNEGVMRWHFTTPHRPAVLTEYSYEGYPFVAVVMPMFVELGTKVEQKDGELPVYDHDGAIAAHRSIVEAALPTRPKPAAKRAAKATKPRLRSVK